MSRRSVSYLVLVAIAVPLFAAIAFAQAKPAAAPAQPPSKPAALPTAESILAKYVDAAGGRAAFDKIRNRVTTGSMDLGAAGISLSLAVYAAKPDRIYTVADSDAVGRIESGVVDGIAWENSAMRGALVKDGAEKADALRDAALDRLVYWKDNTNSAECVDVAEVDGKPAYKVILKPKTGGPQTIYFDRETFLPVQFEVTMTIAAQRVDIVSKPGDYRVVDGVKIPFTVRQFVMGQERVITLDKVEHNVDLPADRFALPPAIKAIVDKK